MEDCKVLPALKTGIIMEINGAYFIVFQKL